MEQKSKIMLVALSLLTLVAGGAAIAAATALRDAPQSGTQMADSTFDPVGLRTQKTPPTFELSDQNGESVSLEQLRGKVVVLTAVYSTCSAACPGIITQAKSAVKKLSDAQREEVVIVAVTLDPEGDTQDKRAATATAHSLEAPLFRYVNGADPAAVLKLVEDLGWARSDGGDTGIIGHSNMFLLIDRAGRIAYTVSADTQLDWLDQGLAALLAEH